MNNENDQQSFIRIFVLGLILAKIGHPRCAQYTQIYSVNLYSKIFSWSLHLCTGIVFEQHFSELLSSSLVECLLLTPEVPGSNPETEGMWEGERSFRVCVL